MAITRRWQSGFETGSTAEISGINTGSYSVVVSTDQKSTGARSCYMSIFNEGYTSWVYQVIPATRQIRVGFAAYLSAPSSNKPYFCFVQDVSNNTLLGLKVGNGTNSLYLTINGTDQDTEAGAWPNNTWTYIGLDMKIDSSAGWCKVYKDGTEILTYSGNTGNADIVRVCFGGTPSGLNMYLDDAYIDDTTSEGSATAPPIKKFYYIIPNGNGNYSQWDGSDGNSTDNYALVDEVPPNSDTDYVYNYVADELDSYAMTTITLGANESVSAVIPTAYIKRASTTEQIALGTRYNSTDSVGSDQNPATSYGILRERQTTKPGGGAWDQTSIDGMEVVIKARGTY